MDQPQINIVIPLYNEEQVFPELQARLLSILKSSDSTIEVILVDDGSQDNTPDLMHELAMKDKRFHSIFLSRNFGHQSALTSGLRYVNASEAVFILDGDLQDPPELLFTFLEFHKKGYEVVYGIRAQRKESLIKRISYKLFYIILKHTSTIQIPLDSGDFSLLSRRVVDKMNSLPEESRFLRGLRSWVGFKQIGITYSRERRAAGESKYPFSELFKLAYNGIFNFSEFPIKMIFRLGMFALIVAVIYFIYTLIKFFYDDTPAGFTALLFTIIMFGGIQLIALSLIGEYVLRIFIQVKNRPLFIVKHRVYKNFLINE